MDGGERSGIRALTRLVAAGFVALFCALGAWLIVNSSPATAGSATGEALLPDLIVEPPDDIVLQGTPGGKTFLRFSHTTSNVGDGPLQIYPDLETESCGEQGDRGRVAYQAIFQDSNGNGTFERNVDTQTVSEPVGCMIYHEIHQHYHFEDFARYQLYRVKSGVLRETSDKVSFCVVDILNTHPELPGAADEPYYSFENCQADSGIHGISVGYADIYGSGTPGQEFDVTERHPGRYCLVAWTDPTDRLSEVATGGEDNNLQTVQIRMNLKNATDFGKSVPIVDEPCSPPA
jgi:Lysyl oxidase